MKTAQKMSRNRQRKQLYASLANTGSRNQEAIQGPIVGRFVERTETKICPRCDGGLLEDEGTRCRFCHGVGHVPVCDATGRPRMVQVIVHDERR